MLTKIMIEAFPGDDNRWTLSVYDFHWSQGHPVEIVSRR